MPIRYLDEQGDSTAAALSVMGAANQNPDQAATTQKYAAALGLPPETVDRNFQDVHRQVQASAARAALANAPSTTAWITDPKNAAVAHQDIPALTGIEAMVRAIFPGGLGTPGQVPANVPAGIYGQVASTLRGAGDVAGVAQRQLLDPIIKGFGVDPHDIWGSKSATALGRVAALYPELFQKASDKAAVGPQDTAAAQVGQGAGQLVAQGAAAVVAPESVMPSLVAQGADPIAREAEKAGNAGTDKADMAIIAGAGGQAVLEKIGLDKILEAVPAAARGKIVHAIATAMTKAGVEGGTEAAQQFVQNLAVKGLINSNQSLTEGVASSGIVGAVLGGAAGGAEAAHADISAHAERAAQAHANKQVADQLAEAVTQNPVTARAPDQLEALMHHAAEGGEVFVPNEKVREFLQTLPPEQAAQTANAWGISDQLAATEGTQADVVIPAGTYFAKVAPTDAHKAFADDLRIGINADSVNEAKDFEANRDQIAGDAATQVTEQARAAEAQTAPGQRVYDDVHAQAVAAGYTPYEAARYAEAWRARYETRGANTGRDAWEAYKASGVTIQAGVAPTPIAMIPDRELGDVTSTMLNVEPAEDRNTYIPLKDSEVAAIKSAGLAVNENGSLPPATRLALMDERFARNQRADAKAAPATTLEQSPVEPLDQFVERTKVEHGLAKFDVTQTASGDLRLDLITLEPTDQLEGRGTAAMKDLVDYADRAGKRITLTPLIKNARWNTTSPKRLADFYKRFGFVENKGKRRDFSTQDAMIREPQPTTLEQKARASITLGDGAVITLFASKDRSSLLHESGHLWLEELLSDAQLPEATEQARADAQTARDWLGMEPDQQRPTVEQHERWARATEAYLMEGVAPSQPLREAFRRFADWLARIYRRASALNVTMTDDVREVMNRLLATQDEIDRAKARQSLNPIFQDAKAAGMSAAEFAAYNKLAEEAKGAARDKLLAATMKTLRDEKTKAWKEERAGLYEVALADLAEQPVFRTLAYIRENKQPISREIVEQMGGKELAAQLPRSAIAKGGMHPDELVEHEAERRKMADKAKVDATLGNKVDRRSVMEARADRIADEQMAERHGDPLNDGSIEREAMDAVNLSKAAELLAVETRYLGRAAGVGEGRWTTQALEDHARAQVNGIVGSKIRPEVFLRAERKAGQEAHKALLSQKYDEALAAKFRQMLNLHLYRAAQDAHEAISEAGALFDKITGAKDKQISKTRDMNLVGAARAILERYSVVRSGSSPSEYMDLVKAYDPDTYAVLKPMIDTAVEGAQPYEKLTYLEVQKLHGLIEQMWKLARRQKVVEIEGRRMEIETLAEELKAELTASGPPKRTPPTDRALSDGERRMNGLLGAKAALTKIEEWAKQKGPSFTRYVWNPVSQAADRYRADKVRFLPKLLDAMKPIQEDAGKAFRIDAPELGYTFGGTKNSGLAELIGALRHVGNDSNKRKLLLGRGWASELEDGSLDTSKWDSFIDRMHREGVLQKRHWDYVQAEWDLHEEIKPLAQRAHQRLYGRYFEEITRNGFDTPFGHYEGGYVPAKADPDLDKNHEGKLDESAAKGGGAGAFMFPTPANGFTKARVEYNTPLDLNLRLALSQMDEVLRFAHLGPAVRDVNRILTNRSMKAAIDAYEPAAWSDMLLPWLERSVSQRVTTPARGAGGRFFDKMMSTIARNTGLSIMFGSITNAAQQVTQFPVASLRTGKRNLLTSLGDYLKDPAGVAERVSNASPLMADRFKNQMVEIQDAAHDLVMNPNLYQKGVRWTVQHAYFMQHAMQNVMDPIIWAAAHSRAVELGEADPAVYADSVIRTSQGSNNPEDLTRFATGPGWARTLKMFTNFFIDQANLLETEWKKAGSAGRMAEVAALGFMAPAIGAKLIAETLNGNVGALLGGEDDDWLGEFLDIFVLSQLQYALAMVPIVGQAVNVGINSFDNKPYNDKLSLSPAASTAESALHAPKDVIDLAQGKGGSGKTIRDVLTLVGMTLGVPLMAVGKPAAYLADVHEGRIHPSGPVDEARGVLTGSTSRASRQ